MLGSGREDVDVGTRDVVIQMLDMGTGEQTTHGTPAGTHTLLDVGTVGFEDVGTCLW